MKDLENKISRTPHRELPPSWKASILATARLSVKESTDWREWLWPSPGVWAVLAACWIVAAVIFVAGPRGHTSGPVDAAALARDIQILQKRAIVSTSSNNEFRL